MIGVGKLLTVLLAVHLCWAMKRSAPPKKSARRANTSTAGPKKPRIDLIDVPEENPILKYFPIELLSLMGAQLVNEYPLRPDHYMRIFADTEVISIERTNPLGYLFCVCKAWNVAMHLEPFHSTFLETPNRAHHLMITTNDINEFVVKYPKAFTAGCPLLDQTERIRLMMQIDHLPSLLAISRLPGYEAISKDDYKRQLKKLLATNPAFGVERVLKFMNFEQLRAHLKTVYELKATAKFERSLVFNLSKTQLVKIFFIEDLYDLNDYSWIFYLLRNSFLHVYKNQPERQPNLKEWLASLTSFVLPRARRPCLVDTFVWLMVLGWICDDRNFSSHFDFESLLSAFGPNQRSEYFHETLNVIKSPRGKELPLEISKFMNVHCKITQDAQHCFDPRILRSAILNDILPHLDQFDSIRRARSLVAELDQQINVVPVA